jgi:hypothetical protein
MYIYKVEFVTYTNGLCNCVTDGTKYITVSKENFLIRESEIEYWKKFGNGFRKLELVGELVTER